MVLTPKKPHIGNTVIHPENGLHYAYYGTVESRARADLLIEKFKKERQWAFTHDVPGKGISIFHRHATMDHPRQPFGKVPPKSYIPIEQALLAAQGAKPRMHRQSEPGESDKLVAKIPRPKLNEQEKRAKKIERRALRRIKKQQDRANQKAQEVMNHLRPDLRL